MDAPFTRQQQRAVMIMVELAAAGAGTNLTAHFLARRIGVSSPVVETIMARLRGCRLVTAARGPGGGYRLARDAREMPLADIARAFIGPPPYAVGRTADERVRDLWIEVHKIALQRLAQTSLAALTSGSVTRPRVADRG